jgi:hypothetical protein
MPRRLKLALVTLSAAALVSWALATPARADGSDDHDTDRLPDAWRSGCPEIRPELESPRWQCDRRELVQRHFRSETVRAVARDGAQGHDPRLSRE